MQLVVAAALPFLAAKRSRTSSPYRADDGRCSSSTSIDRHSFVIAIGGGARARRGRLRRRHHHRGIRHIRVPTTVLAQNDSGVGVKNGVNCLRREEFPRHLRAAFRRAQRFDFHRPPAGTRQDRRHGRGGQGGADPRCAPSSLWLERAMPTRSPLFEPEAVSAT